ncbi:MAG: saccharopine dehydrogenase NADP-binding domain-containing protein [Vicinamibacteria bacterium]|nr:saccharopine dehydrogenase NADP-binding domain-containing protein [Vicinamibacteria bacterium]
MKKKVVILGGGMIGSAMALDLKRSGALDVTLADVREETVSRLAKLGIASVQADLGNPAAVQALVAGYDLVLGALPSVLGLQTLRAVIEAGRDYVDISFMPEDATQLDELARERGVTAVVDCGVSPGMSNIMIGHGARALDRVERAEILVGGLPVERAWPFDYKAGFAPHDVIEEYVRPARMVENGRLVVKEALSEPELIHFPGVGTLEAFNTDGLRSLIRTIEAPFMKEKTLRYPGHIGLMRVLRDVGFFGKDPIQVKGQSVCPLDLTATLMFPRWTFEEQEADITVMRVFVEGVRGAARGGERVRMSWDLYDAYDPATKLRSMSRTTAFPATIVAGFVAEGRYRNPGVNPPELLGRDAGLLEPVIAALAERGVRCTSEVQVLGPAEPTR